MSYKHRIEVGFSQKTLDSVANSTEQSIKEDLGINDALQIRFAEVYYFGEGIDGPKLHEIAKKVMLDPIVQIFAVDSDLYPSKFSIEVMLHDGVTDNLAIVTKEAAEDYLGEKISEEIKTSKKYYFSGNTKKETLEKIASGLLANTVIEKFVIEAKK